MLCSTRLEVDVPKYPRCSSVSPFSSAKEDMAVDENVVKCEMAKMCRANYKKSSALKEMK